MDTTISIRRWKGPWTRRKTVEAATIGVTLLAAFWVFTATNHRTKLSLQLQGSNACPFPAIFNFGDSNSDTGCVSAVFGRLSPPNGRSFFGKPSGRYSDGRLIIDFMAEKLGLPYLNAYLDSVESNFRHGANFAASGSTIKPVPSMNPIHLSIQLSQFEQLKERTIELYNQAKRSYAQSSLPRPEDFSKALYTMDTGQNDLHAGLTSMTEEQVRTSIPSIIDHFASVVEIAPRKSAQIHTYQCTTASFYTGLSIELTMSASGSGRGRKRKNVAGNRTDPGWEHGIEIDAATKKVQCKYCNVTRSGGIYRLKHHLACTHQNVEPCPQVPEDVRGKFMSLLRTQTLESQNKKRKMFDVGDDSEEEVELLAYHHQNKQKRVGAIDKFVMKKSGRQNQKTLNQMFKKEERDDVCQTIARFFYTSAIPFNCVNNPIFPLMVKKIGDYGKGLVPPSYHEIRVTFLKKEVHETLQLVDEFKEQWKKTGCTIMSDGWSDRKRRSICNFLVNSPNGTIFLSSLDTSDISKTGEKVFEMLDEVVEKVGEENVVQVVTDNASNYKLAGQMLMDKRKGLFWTPCAAHCIDLMLEDFEKEIQVHRVTIGKGKKIVAYIYSRTNLIHWMKEFTKDIELIRPAVTRFATSYLTLRRLHEQKGALFSLFTSNKWRNSKFAKSEKGKKIENIVLDNRYFWKGVSTCLKAAVPLIKVLRLVDSDEHPAMGFIYEAMDRAKEEIQKNFNNIMRCYDPIWAIIDRRWETQLHHPLHAAAYFLNPQLHYSPNFQADAEIKIGLYKCLEKMVPDTNERVKIDLQIDAFKNARGLFGIQNAILTRKKKSPGDWWDSFGDECPELKRFAIRVLSLTCSSSGCERNWSAFEMVHSKRRNRLHQKRMNDLVFVMYNLKLRQRHKNRQSIMNPLCLDDVPSDDEWITEKENPTLPREGNWLHVLDRNARHGCHSEDEEADALARDLEQACRDHIGENVDEIHEVSDDDDMDDNMNAPRDFDDDFDDATIGDDDIEELGDTVGDDEDEGDNEIDNVVDCGNDDFGDEDDDLF